MLPARSKPHYCQTGRFSQSLIHNSPPFPFFTSTHSPPPLRLSLINMESQSIVNKPEIAQLCDVLLELLRGLARAASEMDAFYGEVRTLRKFLDLIDRVFKAKLPRMSFEEQHFTGVEVLLDRCRTTLSRLSAIFAASGTKSREVSSQDSQETLEIMQSSEVLALRARISLYTQTLQMSLQTVKL